MLYVNNEFECFIRGSKHEREGMKHEREGMKHEREARVFYCFRVFGSPDESRETSCLHNISNENISLAVQFIKR